MTPTQGLPSRETLGADPMTPDAMEKEIKKPGGLQSLLTISTVIRRRPRQQLVSKKVLRVMPTELLQPSRQQQAQKL